MMTLKKHQRGNFSLMPAGTFVLNGAPPGDDIFLRSLGIVSGFSPTTVYDSTLHGATATLLAPGDRVAFFDTLLVFDCNHIGGTPAGWSILDGPSTTAVVYKRLADGTASDNFPISRGASTTIGIAQMACFGNNFGNFGESLGKYTSGMIINSESNQWTMFGLFGPEATPANTLTLALYFRTIQNPNDSTVLVDFDNTLVDIANYFPTPGGNNPAKQFAYGQRITSISPTDLQRVWFGWGYEYEPGTTGRAHSGPPSNLMVYEPAFPADGFGTSSDGWTRLFLS